MLRVLLMLLLPIVSFGQSTQTGFQDADLENQWGVITGDWRYRVGDTRDWASPDYDDSDWKEVKGLYIKAPDSVLKESNEVVTWFRTTLSRTISATDELVMRVDQTGASEIYLDGKLLHTLGTVSNDPDSVVFYNSNKRLLSFPLKSDTTQVLAVRFVNAASQFPLYSVNSEGFIIRVATLKHSNTDDPPIKQFTYGYYVILGVAIFMFLLFLSGFLFFPSEKINSYFAASSLCFALFVVSVLASIYTHGISLWIDFAAGLFVTAQALLILYCIYKIFDQRFGILYWVILVIGALHVPLLFVFSYELISPILSILVLFETIRISLKTFRVYKKRSLIFLIFGGLHVIFWMVITLNQLGVIEMTTLWVYQPFALLLVPSSLALYLGYSFGLRSQRLQNKLKEVALLSEEKQQLLAQQNIHLEEKVEERTAALNESLLNLKATQSQLIQSEKMASLGELTAGIAHEIQNPMNFVNNFSELSTELITEMNEELSEGNYKAVVAIAGDLKVNLEKINHHGKRADAIVQGMLQHSRTNRGVKEPVAINSLCDEYLRLAYHGLRAKDKSFNTTLHTDYDERIGKISIVPQDIGRVVLNLITNAFYAVKEKQQLLTTTPEGNDFKPVVTLTTKKTGNEVIIIIGDNGNGISEAYSAKIFQPFFTTKPAGKGTGLGLSLSYDIIKSHEGELTVESEVHKYTNFIIKLPVV